MRKLIETVNIHLVASYVNQINTDFTVVWHLFLKREILPDIFSAKKVSKNLQESRIKNGGKNQMTKNNKHGCECILFSLCYYFRLYSTVKKNTVTCIRIIQLEYIGV